MADDTRSDLVSREDLVRWGAELVREWGVACDPGYHVIVWEHDEACPLNPMTNPRHESASGCRCRPDGSLLLHVGTAEQRRLPLVRDGVPLRFSRSRSPIDA